MAGSLPSCVGVILGQCPNGGSGAAGAQNQETPRLLGHQGSPHLCSLASSPGHVRVWDLAEKLKPTAGPREMPTANGRAKADPCLVSRDHLLPAQSSPRPACWALRSNLTQARSALPRLHRQPSNSSSLRHQDPQPLTELFPALLPQSHCSALGNLNKRMPAQMASGGGPHPLQSPWRG